MRFLLLLETVGTTELLVILVVALIIFGPRKLPQMARKVGQTMAEFKRSSEDFRRTWEMEVEQEQATRAAQIERAMLPDETPSASAHADDAERGGAAASERADEEGWRVLPEERSIARGAAPATTTEMLAAETHAPAAPEPSSKRDWL